MQNKIVRKNSTEEPLLCNLYHLSLPVIANDQEKSYLFAYKMFADSVFAALGVPPPPFITKHFLIFFSRSHFLFGRDIKCTSWCGLYFSGSGGIFPFEGWCDEEVGRFEGRMTSSSAPVGIF